RKMTLHKFGAPELPFLQEFRQRFLSVFVCVAPEQFARGGRSTGARIEQRNVHFALRERAVNERKIADHRGKKSKAESRFGDGQKARESRAGNDVAKAESKERRAAQVGVGPETGLHAGHVD